MLLKELLALREAEQSKEEIADLLRWIETNVLDRAARYKEFDIDMKNKTVLWVTQETTPAESQVAADTFAKEFEDEEIPGWTFKVVGRDDFTSDHPWNQPWTTAPWKIAKSK